MNELQIIKQHIKHNYPAIYIKGVAPLTIWYTGQYKYNAEIRWGHEAGASFIPNGIIPKLVPHANIIFTYHMSLACRLAKPPKKQTTNLHLLPPLEDPEFFPTLDKAIKAWTTWIADQPRSPLLIDTSKKTTQTSSQN